MADAYLSCASPLRDKSLRNEGFYEKMDEQYETMYVFYEDNLLVIQVGLMDEGPRFIAYR